MSDSHPSYSLENWTGAQPLVHRVLRGRLVLLEPLDISKHGSDLYRELVGPDADPKLFDYTFSSPFENQADFDAFLADKASCSDRHCYAVIDIASEKAQALLALLCTSQLHGTMKLDIVLYGTSMQRSTKATEALYLLADESFALGYRRFEWLSNNDNVRQKKAAERFGFKFEGVLRQTFVIKGRNWDRACRSILDHEWPNLRTSLTCWLAPENFDSHGQQLNTLESIRTNLATEK